MLVVGAVILVVFLAIEWKYASLPIMPRKSIDKITFPLTG